MDDQDLAKHSAIMLISTMAANFFNYLYQLLMGRLLSKEDYGVLYGLLSLIYIVSVGGAAVQTSVTRYTSKLKAHKEYGKIRYLWDFSTSRTLLLGIVFFIVLSLLSPLVSQFLNLDNVWYVVLLALFLLFSFILPANMGFLMGLQKFIDFGSANALVSLLKLLLGVLLVLMGFGIYGGLLSLSLASLVVLIITFLVLQNALKKKPETFNLKSIYSYSGLALLAMFSFTTMTYLDVILAKHYLTPDAAGEYSALAVLGKIILFAPAGIALAMFPKTSENFEKRKAHSSILEKALLYTIAIGGFAALLFFLFPNELVWIMFGDKYPAIVPYMFRYGLAMLLFSLANLLMSYNLSIHKTSVAYLISLALVVQIILLASVHSSISDLTNSMLVSGMIATILMLLHLK